jgi:hypothetical protein
LGNPQNEQGFKILVPELDANQVPTGLFVEFAKTKANATRWTDPTPGKHAAYQVVAYNVAGDSKPSSSLIEQAPMAPTSLTAAASAFNSVTLNWSGNSTNNALEVVRDGVVIKTGLPGTTSSYVDGTVTAMMTYGYQIRAINAFGSPITNPAVVVTTPMIPVADPTNVTATVNTAGTAATVRWVDAANNDTAYWLEVSVDGGAFAAPIVVNSTVPQRTAVNRVMTSNYTTAPGSIYVFKVTAINVTGNATSKSASVSTTLDLSAPVAPSAPLLAAGAQTANRAAFSWPAVTVPVTVPATTVSYVVQTGTNGVLNMALAAQAGLTYNLAIAAGNTYSMQVSAQSTRFGGVPVKSAVSNVLTVNTPPAATTGRPAATAGATGTKAITVTWTNSSSNITSWTVRRTVGNATTTITPTVTATGTSYSFVDTVPAAGRYSYQVQATSSPTLTNALSGASNTVTAP